MEDTFLRLLDEIEKCIDQKLYIAALTLSLTIPDICGKAEYPEMKNKSKARYIKWYDRHIGRYEDPNPTTKEFRAMPYTSGELLYSLRCRMLHEGLPEVNAESITEDRCKVNRFEIVIDDVAMGGGSSMSINMGKITERTLTVNLLNLCFKIREVARGYYLDNKEKFKEFNYVILDQRREESRNVDFSILLGHLGDK